MSVKKLSAIYDTNINKTNFLAGLSWRNRRSGRRLIQQSPDLPEQTVLSLSLSARLPNPAIFSQDNSCRIKEKLPFAMSKYEPQQGFSNKNWNFRNTLILILFSRSLLRKVTSLTEQLQYLYVSSFFASASIKIQYEHYLKLNLN